MIFLYVLKLGCFNIRKCHLVALSIFYALQAVIIPREICQNMSVNPKYGAFFKS